MVNFKYDEGTNEAIFNGRWRMSNVHKPGDCTGTSCLVHSRSDTPANRGDWPYVFRGDGRIERTCEHGVGHPDKDQVTYLINTTGETHWGVHACDSCCFTKEKNV